MIEKQVNRILKREFTKVGAILMYCAYWLLMIIAIGGITCFITSMYTNEYKSTESSQLKQNTQECFYESKRAFGGFDNVDFKYYDIDAVDAHIAEIRRVIRAEKIVFTISILCALLAYGAKRAHDRLDEIINKHD